MGHCLQRRKGLNGDSADDLACDWIVDEFSEGKAHRDCVMWTPEWSILRSLKSYQQLLQKYGLPVLPKVCHSGSAC